MIYNVLSQCVHSLQVFRSKNFASQNPLQKEINISFPKYDFPWPCTLKIIWIFTAIFYGRREYRLDNLNKQTNEQIYK